MADNFRFAQLQPYSLAGSGTIIGDTSIVLKSMKDIDGNNVVFSTVFGTKGFGTMQAGQSTSEEQISFTGITQNSNGTATLTGVKSVTFVYPYTETSGLLKTHAGSTEFIISNTSGFYNEFTSKDDDETINGIYTFTQSPIVPTGGTGTQAANNQDIANAITGVSGTATNTTFGTVKLSVAAASVPDPIAVGDNDTRVPTQGENDALVGNNTDIAVGTGNKFVTQTGFQKGAELYGATATGNDTYVVTLSPIPTSLVNGMTLRFKADVANTGTATLNVNSLGALALVTGVSTPLATGDIVANQVCQVIYNSTGTVWQLVNPSSSIIIPTSYTNGTATKDTADASGVQNIAHGLGIIPKKIKLTCIYGVTNGGTMIATSAYNGTTQSSISVHTLANNTVQGTVFRLNGNSTAGGYQEGVITFDATNIIITWTKTNLPTGIYQILWEAQT